MFLCLHQFYLYMYFICVCLCLVFEVDSQSLTAVCHYIYLCLCLHLCVCVSMSVCMSVSGWEGLLVHSAVLLSLRLCGTKGRRRRRPHRSICCQLFWRWSTVSEVGETAADSLNVIREEHYHPLIGVCLVLLMSDHLWCCTYLARCCRIHFHCQMLYKNLAVVVLLNLALGAFYVAVVWNELLQMLRFAGLLYKQPLQTDLILTFNLHLTCLLDHTSTRHLVLFSPVSGHGIKSAGKENLGVKVRQTAWCEGS